MSYYSDYDYEDYGLKRHKLSDAIKWLIVFVLVLGLIGAVISLFVMLDRQTTVTEIGAEQYMVGGLDEEGAPIDTDISIVTRTGFSANGIKTEVADGAAQSAADLRQLLGTEKEQHDDQNDEDFLSTNTKHGKSLP